MSDATAQQPPPPCYDCGTTEAPRSACPLCGKVFCQPCAEAPYEYCCDKPDKPKPEVTR